MKIRNLTFDNPVFLAPMAGVTDISFRGLCKELGCGLLYTEMVSAKALHYESKNTKSLLRVSEEEMPVAVQIFGREPELMANIVEKHFNERDDICIIDINMGCPAPKIVKNGEGSALMKEPKLAAEIIREIKKISTKPVTAKFRKGFDDNNINAVEFAKRLEEAGADAIAIHGRTKAQMYDGKADWEIIADVKNSVKIPVIGNGDVFTPEDAFNIKELTNCDGIMVARGSMGNPWLFKQIWQKLNGEEVVYPTAKEKVEMCIKHYKRALEHEGEFKAIREMRKHAAWYIKGLTRCTDIKDKLNAAENSEEAIDILKKYSQIL